MLQTLRLLVSCEATAFIPKRIKTGRKVLLLHMFLLYPNPEMSKQEEKGS